MKTFLVFLAAAALLSVATVDAGAADGCASAGTVGTGGSAAAGGTSASTLGTAGACSNPDGTDGSIASGGSAAAADGSADSRTHVIDTNGGLKAKSAAAARDQGTWSRSKTQTRVTADGDLSSRTKSMAHVPGEKPVKSTTAVESPADPTTTGSTAACDPSAGACP